MTTATYGSTIAIDRIDKASGPAWYALCEMTRAQMPDPTVADSSSGGGHRYSLLTTSGILVGLGGALRASPMSQLSSSPVGDRRLTGAGHKVR